MSHQQLLSRETRTRYDDVFDLGYADAREYGRAGFFMPSEWSEELRLRYLAGFERGLKIYRKRFKN